VTTIGGMDVTPQLLHDVEFREAKRGGYNTQDVDEFLERLAVGLERQDAQLREARHRLEEAEARALAVEQRAAAAERRAGDAGEADETLKRTLVLAQRTADAAIQEAQQEAAQTIADAQEQATLMVTEAEEASARARADADREAREAHEEARARALAELRELEAARDQVQHDVDALEAHLADQRERIRIVAHELEQLLDDPTSLGPVPRPEVSDVGAPQLFQAEEPPRSAAMDADPGYDAPDWTPEEEAWSEPERAPAPRREVPLAADAAPPTGSVGVYDHDADGNGGDDRYLAELRKAMTDDSPLGPRDDASDDPLIDRRAEAGRSRFGRRR
jgi:DivIVA domain-containing protein